VNDCIRVLNFHNLNICTDGEEHLFFKDVLQRNYVQHVQGQIKKLFP